MARRTEGQANAGTLSHRRPHEIIWDLPPGLRPQSARQDAVGRAIDGDGTTDLDRPADDRNLYHDGSILPSA